MAAITLQRFTSRILRYQQTRTANHLRQIELLAVSRFGPEDNPHA